MNVVSASTMRRESRTSLRLEAACEFSAVRAATLAVRAWLAEKNLPEADLAAWELALIEAANNAVKYAGERGAATAGDD
jgi:anti-sigma regulatory factor (Ser/Thr protein kinase)